MHAPNPESLDGASAARRALAATLLSLFLLSGVLAVLLWQAQQSRRAVAAQQAQALAASIEGQTRLLLRNLQRALGGIASDGAQFGARVPEQAGELMQQSAADVAARHPELASLVLLTEAPAQCSGSAQLGLLPAEAGRIGEDVLPLLMAVAAGPYRCIRAELRMEALAALLDLPGLEAHGEALLRLDGGSVIALRRAGRSGLSGAALESWQSIADARETVSMERRVGDFPLHVEVRLPRPALGALLAPLVFAALLALVGGMVALRALRRLGRDFDVRRRVLTEAARSHARLHDAQQQALVGSFDLDAKGRPRHLSPLLRELLGLPAQELGCRAALRRLPQPVRSRLLALLRAPSAQPLELEFVRASDGDTRTLRLLAAWTGDASGLCVRGTLQDVSEAAAARQRLIEAERRYRVLFENNPMPQWIVDAQTLAIREFNTAAERLYGFAADELRGESMLRLLRPQDHAAFRAGLASHGDSRSQVARWTHLDRDGREREVLQYALALELDGCPAWLMLALDLSERMRAEAERAIAEERFRLLARATSDAIWDLDLKNHSLWWSDSFFSVFGYRRDEVGPELDFWSTRLHPDDAERVNGSLEAAMSGAVDRWQETYRFLHANGHYVEVLDRGYVIRDAEGRAVRMVGGMMDISERNEFEQQLAWQASHDALTGLANRAEALRELGRRIDSAPTPGLGAVLVDLDHFKLINDSLGHGVGDEVLRQVARRLQSLAAERDFVARFGGDEFLLLVDGRFGGSEAERLLAQLGEPIEALGTLHYLTPSIGHARWPDDANSAEGLLKSAELAMFAAKRQGRNCAVAFSPEFEHAVSARLDVISRLRRALEQGEFELHYQPKFSVDGARFRGLEALVRWRHPERGLLPPGQFIEICEDSGLIVPLGRWVLREACRQHAALREAGCGEQAIAVNVSAAQFLRGDLVAEVAAALREFALPPGALELELTESVVMEDPARAAEAMSQLKGLGVRLSMDDFGTGYSSLSNLKRLPLDSLKIDRAFVGDLGSDPEDEAICASIIAMARALGLRVIAEGVETEAQRAWLAARGCDEVQGYLFARPAPIGEALGKIADCPDAP
jgi:diguanylate cyclase (GGDEF)-like protein/PAS domain S-box-containing protein